MCVKSDLKHKYYFYVPNEVVRLPDRLSYAFEIMLDTIFYVENATFLKSYFMSLATMSKRPKLVDELEPPASGFYLGVAAGLVAAVVGMVALGAKGKIA